ncbi:hypothetical protein [Corynebacterium sp. AOP40-4SA-5]|uniref:hypothetical protein n=1 Tax=Corynebacterium sp. AOP40-4SA-5 TaxID=3457678 RepID=UPI004033651C
MSQHDTPRPPVIPSWMIGGELFTGAVEVRSVDGLDTTKEGKPKASKGFPGLLPFKVTVEFLRGVREKKRLDGQALQLPDYDQISVKVWGEGSPQVEVGDYVRLIQPMVGSVDGNLFVQAVGLVKVEPKTPAASKEQA